LYKIVKIILDKKIHLVYYSIVMDKQAVYEDIKQQIAKEKLLPGQWLVERELCTTYSMSRTPVREILWKLTADGFLKQESNRGFTVMKLGLEQIFEVFQTREAVEGMAARLASRKGDESFRSRLKEIKGKLIRVDVEVDPSRGSALGRQMHHAIMQAAGNSMMVDIYGKLKNLATLTSNIATKSSAIERISKEAHLEIIKAILDQDEEKSERVMREHLRETCRQVVEQFYPNMLGGASNNK
jgi:DNA-binding GntR family transcriptional regulator